ncbi:MAG: CrcB family protein [Balneolales bacterium]
MFQKVIMVGLGGALGALLRYSFLVLFPYIPGAFPYTVFMENMIGSFLLGFILIVFRNKWKPAWPARAFFGTGLLSSFTTFSNLTMNLVTLTGEGHIITAVAYMMASVLAGLACAFWGMMLARKWGGSL